jgi:hypothetical protein
MIAPQTLLDVHLMLHEDALRRNRHRWFRFRGGRSPATVEVALAA